MRDHVLVEDDDVVEAFEQVEGDLGLPFGDKAPDFAEVVVDAERFHFVPHAGQRRDDVVFGAPRRRDDVGPFFDRLRRNQMLVHERNHTQLGRTHSATLCRPLCK